MNLRRELNEIKSGNKMAGVVEQKVMESYERFLERVKGRNRREIRTEAELVQIYGNKGIRDNYSSNNFKSLNTNVPTLNELKTLLIIHYS